MVRTEGSCSPDLRPFVPRLPEQSDLDAPRSLQGLLFGPGWKPRGPQVSPRNWGIATQSTRPPPPEGRPRPRPPSPAATAPAVRSRPRSPAAGHGASSVTSLPAVLHLAVLPDVQLRHLPRAAEAGRGGACVRGRGVRAAGRGPWGRGLGEGRKCPWRRR